MNSKTYIKLLAREWGVMKEEELEKKLHKLCNMVRNEISSESRIDELVELSKVKKEIKSEVIESTRPEISLKYEPDYDKVMKLLRKLSENGWQHISVIPDDLFAEFWKISEINKKIIFDTERDYQYFKVEFKSNSFAISEK
jgi:hypothetical protein